jgi:thiamine biosynthesis protein ThiS
MSAQTVRIVVNGRPHELPRPLAVAELLSQLEIAPRGIAVEVNLQLVPRAKHAEHVLRDGDRLEIVSLVGGG